MAPRAGYGLYSIGPQGAGVFLPRPRSTGVRRPSSSRLSCAKPLLCQNLWTAEYPQGRLGHLDLGTRIPKLGEDARVGLPVRDKDAFP